MNPYEKYYLNQAGSGVATYTGVRYQKGNGFFGRIISGIALPLLKYFGQQGLEAAGAVANKIKANPELKIKDVLRDQAKDTLNKVVNDSASRAKKFIQTGKGIKKNKSAKKPTTAKKPSTKKSVSKKKKNTKSNSFLK